MRAGLHLEGRGRDKDVFWIAFVLLLPFFKVREWLVWMVLEGWKAAGIKESLFMAK